MGKVPPKKRKPPKIPKKIPKPEPVSEDDLAVVMLRGLNEKELAELDARMKERS